MSNKANPEILTLPVDLSRTTTLSDTNREDVYSFSISAPTDVLMKLGEEHSFQMEPEIPPQLKLAAIKTGMDLLTH